MLKPMSWREGMALAVVSRDPTRPARRPRLAQLRPVVENDRLPYSVELWDPDGAAVEQLLALTSTAWIGQAAFYAAAREYPDRYITLRRGQQTLNRWNTGRSE